MHCTKNDAKRILAARAAEQAELLARWREMLAQLQALPQTPDVRVKVATAQARIQEGAAILAILDQEQAKYVY